MILRNRTIERSLLLFMKHAAWGRMVQYWLFIDKQCWSPYLPPNSLGGLFQWLSRGQNHLPNKAEGPLPYSPFELSEQKINKQATCRSAAGKNGSGT